MPTQVNINIRNRNHIKQTKPIMILNKRGHKMRILDKWGLQQRFRMRLHVYHV